MEKYLGNKTSLLPLLGQFVEQRAPDARSISDLFAGTTNVSRYFRLRNFDVAVGDLNRFTYILAHTYLGLRAYPTFDVVARAKVRAGRLERIQLEFLRAAKKYEGWYVESGAATGLWARFAPLARALAYLQTVGEENKNPGVITEYYTQWGRHSGFVSMRGTSGKRNYFSKDNALFLDGVLMQVRAWWRESRISREELFLLMTSIIEEIVITANVNGTFHDFNRTRLWPNANQSFFLRLPITYASKGQFEAVNDDAISAARYISDHDICYIDPPYNFRQYTSYYHFLNFVAAFPFISEPRDYLEQISFVRGQNIQDDHSSEFCYRDRFIEKLRELVEAVDSRYVLLSYYSGRNHWNHWSKVSAPTDRGLQELRAMFEDVALFQDCEIVPALDIRRNYQSRSGEQKQLVNEYLFFGVRQLRARPAAAPIAPLPANQAVGISEQFPYVFAPREEFLERELRIMAGA